MPWSFTICGPHPTSHRNSSAKQPRKRSWGHPQEPRWPPFSYVYGQLLDKFNAPCLFQSLYVHISALLLTQFTKGLLGILAFSQSEDERCRELGTATAKCDVFEAECQKYDFTGNRISSGEDISN